MGRPINKKFFGNLRSPYTDIPTSQASGVGGESVDAVAVVNPAANGPYATTATITFSAPQLTGGTRATGTVTINTTTNSITTVTLVNRGSGYTTAPTITVSPATTGTTATFTISLTSNTPNAIAFTSYLLAKDGGSSAITGGDIHKQEASRRYLVENAQGMGQCKLVTAEPLTPGTMFITATDVNGSTYYVKKLTARRVTLVRKTMVGSYEYVTNASAGWTLGSASAGVVSLSSN